MDETSMAYKLENTLYAVPVSRTSGEPIKHLLGNQRDAILGTPEAARILPGILTNNHSWRNSNTVVDYASVQPRSAANINIRQQYRPIDLGVGVNTARREQQ